MWSATGVHGLRSERVATVPGSQAGSLSAVDELNEALTGVVSELGECEALLAPGKLQTKAKAVLQGLGFTEELLARPSDELSGGWRMRAALAQALFTQPDVLMLDEPTNHLDLEAVGWLETELVKLDETDTIVLIVSHDRSFLAATATDIVEFTGRKLVQWAMDFDEYIEAKEMAAAKMAQQVGRCRRSCRHARGVHKINIVCEETWCSDSAYRAAGGEPGEAEERSD
jgi:ATPase subunit of ABC transporter with duplicated ATPase domains